MSSGVSLVRADDRLSATWYSDDDNLQQTYAIDFIEGSVAYRIQRSQHELVVRAVLGKKRDVKRVIDCTAGLGRESMMLASQGVEVIMLERDPTIAALLEDALHRASQHSQMAGIVEKITLINEDARDWLKAQRASADNIVCQSDVALYCDPMFPARSKQAKVKKEMQLFQRLLGHQNYSDIELMDTVLTGGHLKTIIKRPINAPLLERSPTYQLKAKAVRFDVYMITQIS